MSQVGHRLYTYDQVGSTNSLALELPEDGAVHIADSQTAGRGQHGKSWMSAPRLGLWFSVCLAGDPKGLPFAAALAVRAALRPRTRAALKWPNDVTLQGRKICGILAEHRDGWTALGIGVNVHHRPEDFPEELRETAGSLESITGEKWDRNDTFCRILLELDRQVSRLRKGEYDRVRNQWATACDIVGKRIARDGLEGTVMGIEEDGALVMNTGDRTVRVDSGVIRIIEGSC
jgi:BirA family biotin operon repressor/biotin-[acetyl-CoA-carboxylase] ligase